MSTVFFKVTDQQNREIQSLMNEEGYTNKAEFFRFLLKFFKYNRSPDEVRLDRAIDDLENTIQTLNKKGMLDNLAPPEKQLADV